MAHLTEELGNWEGRHKNSGGGGGVGGTRIKNRMHFFFYINMNATSNRRTWQVGGEAQCAILLFK